MPIALPEETDPEASIRLFKGFEREVGKLHALAFTQIEKLGERQRDEAVLFGIQHQSPGDGGGPVPGSGRGALLGVIVQIQSGENTGAGDVGNHAVFHGFLKLLEDRGRSDTGKRMVHGISPQSRNGFWLSGLKAGDKVFESFSLARTAPPNLRTSVDGGCVTAASRGWACPLFLIEPSSRGTGGRSPETPVPGSQVP